MGITVVDVGEGPAGQADPSYLEVARRLMGSARDLVGAQAADDLVFDTMSTLLPRWDRITRDKVADARRSMVNRFRDHGRHLRVEATHRHTFVTPDREEPANDRVASRLDLSAVLHLLPERTRQVLVLRYQLDLSAADLAVILGITLENHSRTQLEGVLTSTVVLEDGSGEIVAILSGPKSTVDPVVEVVSGGSTRAEGVPPVGQCGSKQFEPNRIGTYTATLIVWVAGGLEAVSKLVQILVGP